METISKDVGLNDITPVVFHVLCGNAKATSLTVPFLKHILCTTFCQHRGRMACMPFNAKRTDLWTVVAPDLRPVLVKYKILRHFLNTRRRIERTSTASVVRIQVELSEDYVQCKN